MLLYGINVYIVWQTTGLVRASPRCSMICVKGSYLELYVPNSCVVLPLVRLGVTLVNTAQLDLTAVKATSKTYTVDSV